MITSHDRERRQQGIVNGAPPLRELAVPIDRGREPFVERDLLRPAEFSELRAIDCISSVVELTVASVLDPVILVLEAEQAQKLLRNVDVRQLIS